MKARSRQKSRHPPSAAAWWWLVVGCGALLLAVVLLLAIWWAATRETRTTTYRVLGDLAGIRLDLGDADVEIDGGGAAVEVRRIDRFAYGAPSEEDRQLESGTLSIRSRCPEQVIGSCRASYRLTVPDNVPLEIQTSSGSVRVSGVRASVRANTGSGAFSATGFCGFLLRAGSDTGDVSAVSKCSPDRRRAALAQRRRARGRPLRPLPDRRAERLRRGPRARAHGHPRRAVPRAGAEHERRRLGRGRELILAVDLAPHLRDARRALLYLFVGLGQGLTYLVIIGGGLVLGVVLAPLWIGLPILRGTIRLTWRLAEGERRQANRLLATHLPPVPRPAPRRLRDDLRSAAYWRVAGMLLLKLPVALLGLAGRPGAGAAGGRAGRASASAGSRARTAGSSGRGSSGRRSGSRCARSRSRPRSSRSPRSKASALRCARSRAGCCAPASSRAAPCASCWPSGSATAR